MRPRLLPAALLALAALVAAPARAIDSYMLAYNSVKAGGELGYIQQLLTAALDASSAKYGAYQLRVSTVLMERQRLLLEMRKGELVNLSAQASSAEWERELIAIRIPLDKGLSGYRVSLIDGRQQADFSAVRTLAQLKALSMGAGRQWSSAEVFADAGFDVVTGNSLAGLHKMLAAGRFRHFPRGVDEAVYEQAANVAAFPPLALEDSFAIYVPLPRYFFVAAEQRGLAERLDYGLRLLIADGRFERLFHQHYDDLIERSGLRRRRIFKLANPLLTPQTPLGHKEYWFDPLARH